MKIDRNSLYGTAQTWTLVGGAVFGITAVVLRTLGRPSAPSVLTAGGLLLTSGLLWSWMDVHAHGDRKSALVNDPQNAIRLEKRSAKKGPSTEKVCTPEQVLTDDGPHFKAVASAMTRCHESRSPKYSPIHLARLKALCDDPKTKDLTDPDITNLVQRARCYYSDCDHDVFRNRPDWQEIAEKFDWSRVVDLSPKNLTALINQTQNELRDAAAAAKKAGKPLLFIFGEGHRSAVSYACERAALEIADELGIKQFLCEQGREELKRAQKTIMLEVELCHWDTHNWIFPTVIKLGLSIFAIDIHHQEISRVGSEESIPKRDQGMADAIQGTEKVASIKGKNFLDSATVKAIPSIAVVGFNHIAGLEKLIKTDRFYPCFVSRYTTDSLPWQLIFPEHMRAAYNARPTKKSGSIGSPR